MEIYRISKLDMMGFRINELFFDSLKKARNEYARLLVDYRKKEKIVKREDVNHLSSPIVRVSTSKSIIKEHMIELWYRWSYEYDEWDTAVEHLQLEIIEVT